MSPFIPNYADTFRHIFRMSHKDFSFDKNSWEGTDYVDEWNKAKEHLRRTCALYHPDRSLEWILKTDASITGYGAVLVQMMPKDRLTVDEQKAAEIQGLVTAEGMVAVPIALISKAFTESARMWTTTEQELYAVIHTLKKLEALLMLKPFVLETDHLNLVSLQEGSIAQSARCTRWRQYLAQFVYVIRHIAGVRNAMADFLSRAMEPIEAGTVTYLAAILSDGLSEQYRDDQDSDRESSAQDSDREPSAIDTDTDNPEYQVYKKPR